MGELSLINRKLKSVSWKCLNVWTGFTMFLLLFYPLSCEASLPHTCPHGCTCQVRDFEGLQTNCSFLGQAGTHAALASIAANTRFLYLEVNNLTYLPPMPFIHLKSMYSLYLDRNNLRDIGKTMVNLSEKTKKMLLSIDLSKNHINKVPKDALADLKSLQSLYLKNNQIEKLTEANFIHANKLQTLDLSGNKLTALPSGCFESLINLQYLFLSNNSLSSISPGVFKSTPHLRDLDLSYNIFHIGVITPGVFDGLDNLQIMKLDGNGLTDLPDQLLTGVPNIKELGLQHNRLRDFPIKALRNLNRLHSLFLSNNAIERIPTEVNLLHSLRYLYINHNNIHTVEPHCLSNLMNLQALWLDYNKIKRLTSDLLDRFRHMEYGQLSFAGNPLQCDCHLVWLARWIRHQNIPNYVMSVPECTAPEVMADKPLIDVTLDEMKCDYTPFLCSGDTLHLAVKAQCSLAKEDTCSRRNTKKSCMCNTKKPCYICPSGSYGSHTGDGGQGCYSCPPFSTSTPGARTRTHCQCLPGYMGHNGGNCTACPKGYYKNAAGDTNCLPCALGSVTSYEASEYCDCQPGFTLMEGGKCQACEENTYKEHPGPLPCSHCPPYSQSPPASNNSDQCECLYGAFRQVTNRKYGKCQEFPDQEQMVIHGFPPAPSEYKSSMPPSHYLNRGSEVGVILGALGSAISVLAVIIVSVFYSRRIRGQKQEKLTPETQPIAEDLHRVHSMLNMYVSNAMYERYEISAGNKLEIGDLIGQGAFGQVHVGLAYGLEQEGRPTKVAIKTLRENATPEEVEALKTELDQMVYVGQHPHVISLLGACTQKGQLMIIMEYAEHGNLLQYVKSRMPSEGYQEAVDGHRLKRESRDKRNKRNIMEDKQLMSLVWQIAKGMAHLTLMKCVHRDLAARNVLLSEGMVAKVSDFGLAREVYESGYYFKSSKGRLPFKWMSPEALLCGHYTTKSDVWSFGVLLWEVAAYGATPYPGIPADQMYEMLKAGYRMKRPHHCPHKLYELMLHCWHECPGDRPSFRELVDRFDKILQHAAKKDYLDIEDDTTYLLSPGTSDSISRPSFCYRDTVIDIHNQHIEEEEKDKPEENEEDDSGHPCRTPPGQQQRISTEDTLSSACDVLTTISSPELGSEHAQWDKKKSGYLAEKNCLSDNPSPSASPNSYMRSDQLDWESCSKDSGMDDSSLTESQAQRLLGHTEVFPSSSHVPESCEVEMDCLLPQT